MQQLILGITKVRSFSRYLHTVLIKWINISHQMQLLLCEILVLKDGLVRTEGVRACCGLVGLSVLLCPCGGV